MLILVPAPRFRDFLLAVALMAGGGSALAQETPDSPEPERLEQESLVPGDIGSWFRSLRVPGTKVSCCDESDCKRTTSRIGPAGYEARAPDGRWIAIPESAIVRGKPNLAREPVLCLSPTQAVYCFVPDNEG
ncbi:MAG: hypothetical protein ACK4NA_07610 [Alphaproteobacteria bacterium]